MCQLVFASVCSHRRVVVEEGAGRRKGLSGNPIPPHFFVMSADAALSVSLAGRMHRTVFVEGCNANFYDELATLMAAKCGPIEARGMVGTRYALVFERYNSISTAVALHGMVFIDMKSKLLIWAADKTPPTEAAQLSIGGGGNEGCSTSTTSEARRARIDAFLSLGGASATSGSKGTTSVTAQEKRLQMFRLCVRQMKALNVLMSFDRDKLAKELAALEASNATTESVLQGLQSST